MSAGWTIETLKEHFEKINLEKDRAISTALAAEKEARTLALSAAKEAVQVAETNAERWRANANEWRGAMMDRETKFMQRSEFIAYKESTEKALAMEKERGDKGEGKVAGYAKFLGWIIAGITIVGFIISNVKLK